MRQVAVPSPLRSALTKSLAISLCLALAVLEAAPAFARNDDDYQTNRNTYSNNYGPQGGYSSSSLELQMQRMTARVQSFTAPPVQYFDASRFTAPKLDFSYQPPIRFQYSPQVKAPEITARPVIKLDNFAPVQKLTFIQNVGQVFKGIGSAITTAFKKIGDGIVNLAQKMFGSPKKEAPVSPQAKEAMRFYTNIKEISPGVVQTQGGQTHALGQSWEPGAKFQVEGNNLRLIEGTAFTKTFGGISRPDGGYLPVRYADDGGKVKPVCLDFNRLPAGTGLKVESPLNIEGFGKIQSGNMVFKGATETPEGPMGRFQFQGAQVNLDPSLADTLDMSGPASLVRASFMAEAAVMQLKSAVVEKGNERLFVSQNHAPIEIGGLEKGANALGEQSAANFSKISTVERDLSARSSAVSQFFKNTSQQTGLEATLNFEFKDDFKNLTTEAGSIRQSTLDLSQSLENESYDGAKDSLQNLQQRQEALTQKAEGLEAQAEPFRELQRGMRGVTNELVAMLPNINAERLKTEAPVSDQELTYRATKYFPEEKARVCQQTDKALEGIKGLVNVGAMTPEQGANLGAQMMAMRDKILGAVPNDALYDQKRAVADPLQITYDTGKSVVNRGADAAFFGRMGKVAESYPTVGLVVGTIGLRSAQTADVVNKVMGTASLVYFGVTASITTAAAIGTAYVAKNVLEYVGVDKEASTSYATVASILVAAKVGSSEQVQAAESWVPKAILSKAQSAWGAVRNVFGSAKQLVMNESGFVVNPTANLVGPESQTSGTKAIVPYWPKNRGFMEPPVKKMLPTGDLIDRFGYDNGKYASPVGTPFETRSLPPVDKVQKPHSIYEVLKPFEVDSGKAAPAFGQIGQGPQYALPKSVQELIDQGYLRKVNK